MILCSFDKIMFLFFNTIFKEFRFSHLTIIQRSGGGSNNDLFVADGGNTLRKRFGTAAIDLGL